MARVEAVLGIDRVESDGARVEGGLEGDRARVEMGPA
jgi:hypothetical protein